MASECYFDNCDHHEKVEPVCHLEECAKPTFIHFTHGDVTFAKQEVIAHQVNCMGVMGAGVALSIRKTFPEHYHDFLNDTRESLAKFGKCIHTHTKEKYIFGLYGQYRYGRSTTKHTDYKALKDAFEELCICITVKHNIYEVAMPFGIGAGLGGGDWNVILAHLTDIANKYKVHIYFYKLK